MGIVKTLVTMAVLVWAIWTLYDFVEWLRADPVDTLNACTYQLNELGYCKDGTLNYDGRVVCMHKDFTVTVSCDEESCYREISQE